MKVRVRAVATLGAWVLGAAATIALLRVAKVDTAADDPVGLAVEAVRRGALVAAWYVVGITAVHAAVRVLRVATLLRLTDALTIGPLRGVVRTALGAGLVGALTLSSPLGALAAPDEPPMVTLHRLPPASPFTTT